MNKPLERKTSSPFIRKPLPQDIPDDGEGTSLIAKPPPSYDALDTPVLGRNKESPSSSLRRHLSLFDLCCIGIGATIGSGLFVLCGLVANKYAGPSSSLSWALAGIAACLSGCCYAEMACRIPAAGSAYAYVFVAIGELPAVLAAMCLSMEYVLAAAAVSRSWADKMVLYLQEESNDTGGWIETFLAPGIFSLSPLAFVISTASTLLLLAGARESKLVTNVFTSIKCAVALFMVLAGFTLLRPSNWTPYFPPQFGVTGMLRGSTATFFGYLGYDEVCCLGAEAKNPKRNLPRAIMLTLVAVTVLYVLAAISLTGMQPYESISSVSGFPAAFQANKSYWAAQIASLGEVLTLPVVVPLTVIGQPRLLYALAQDGLVPQWFGKVDTSGNLYNATLVSGVAMILIATIIPFEHLNDMISAAVLLALGMTDTSLILMWHDSPPDHPFLAEKILLAFHISCFVCCLLISHFWSFSASKPCAFLCFVVMLLSLGGIMWCPQSDVFGGKLQQPKGATKWKSSSQKGYFRTPFIPVWPCVGILINWYLISQLELTGILGLILFLGIAALFYFTYGAQHSVANNGGWEHQETSTDSTPQVLLRPPQVSLKRSGSIA